MQEAAYHQERTIHQWRWPCEVPSRQRTTSLFHWDRRAATASAAVHSEVSSHILFLSVDSLFLQIPNSCPFVLSVPITCEQKRRITPSQCCQHSSEQPVRCYLNPIHLQT